MVVLGITHPVNQNPAACLIVDGRLIAFAEEERFVRFKHASNFYPSCAVQYCLESAGLSLNQIDATAVGFGCPKQGSLTTEDVDGFISGTLPFSEISRVMVNTRLIFHTTQIRSPGKVYYYDHHECHAASAFLPSNFKSCNVITLDGWGGETRSGLLGSFKDGSFNVLREVHPSNSWGILYELVTQAIGFRMHSAEGKTMGLAPYSQLDESILPDWCEPELGLPDVGRYRETGW